MADKPEGENDRPAGRVRVEKDVVTLAPCRGMAALLDRDPSGLDAAAPLPPGWHWLFFHEAARQSELGEDGHERRGKFLPDLPYPRRMWAGGRMRFIRPLHVGDTVERHSTIASVEEKDGRSGPLLFVTVHHTIHADVGPAIEEEQTLVYREARRPGDPVAPSGAQPPGKADWHASFLASPVALFRFSALTFNGHRIHYDHPHATDVEGYPGLVVHAPLLALLLLDAATRNESSAPAAFSYRAVAPAFGGETITVAGKAEETGDRTDVWAESPERGVVMKGVIEWSPAP